MPTFLDHLPQGVSYPDTDPYIQELNRRMPSTQFDRYLPSETVRRDIEKMRERIAVEDPEFAATMDTSDIPDRISWRRLSLQASTCLAMIRGLCAPRTGGA